MDDQGEELEDEGDWIVDDDGGYEAGETEKKWSKGRTEVGAVTLLLT